MQGSSELYLHQFHCQYSQLSIASSLHMLVRDNIRTIILFIHAIWYFAKFSYHLFTGAGGLTFLQFCNLNSFRTMFILGFSLFMGLSVPQYFNEYTSVAGYGPVHTRARWVRQSHQPFYIMHLLSILAL